MGVMIALYFDDANMVDKSSCCKHTQHCVGEALKLFGWQWNLQKRQLPHTT